MDGTAYARVNQDLADLVAGRVPEVRVDTMRHPYALLPGPVAWPAVTVTGILPEEQTRVAEVLATALPGFVKGCHLLPEPRPRRDSNQVQLVRPYRFVNTDYLYMIRISAEYMGGAGNPEVLEPARQGRSPSFLTDRIYFHARLFPVRSIARKDFGICDFEAFTIHDAHFLVRAKGGEEGARSIFTTALFDQIDFGPVEDRFMDLFSFGSAWKGGRVFRPLVIDHLTLALNLLVPDIALVEDLAPRFADAFARLVSSGHLDDLSEPERDFWRAYYGAWAFENDFSRGGNPQWRLTTYPDERWRKRILG